MEKGRRSTTRRGFAALAGALKLNPEWLRTGEGSKEAPPDSGPEEETFGDRIRNRRKELGLSQKQLADYIGVTQTAVASWENDLRALGRGDHFMRLAEALGFDPEDMMRDMRGGADRSKEEVILLGLFRALPEEKREALLIVLEEMQ
jgi:transcriptional regulator with XRE-family HTH domain